MCSKILFEEIQKTIQSSVIVFLLKKGLFPLVDTYFMLCRSHSGSLPFAKLSGFQFVGVVCLVGLVFVCLFLVFCCCCEFFLVFVCLGFSFQVEELSPS